MAAAGLRLHLEAIQSLKTRGSSCTILPRRKIDISTDPLVFCVDPAPYGTATEHLPGRLIESR